MLQAAKTDLFNPLVPKAHNSVKIYHFLYKFNVLKTSVRAACNIYFLQTIN